MKCFKAEAFSNGSMDPSTKDSFIRTLEKALESGLLAQIHKQIVRCFTSVSLEKI
jgi:hypothetical protein